MKRIARLSPVTKERVGCYVYLLLDPRDGRPFYVGKGKGDRVFKHLAAARRGADGAKSDRIREFYEAGLEPNLDILRYGLDDASAFNVEAAALLAMATSENASANGVGGY